MTKLRVVVIDDSSFLRRTIPRLLERDPDIKVVGTAVNGAEGVQMVKDLRPDVVTLDVMMPVMDGITALKMIMREAPTPVVMVSSMTGEGERETLEALQHGAVDFITKPSGPISLDIEKVSVELIEKVKAASTTKNKLPTSADAARDKFRSLVESLSPTEAAGAVARAAALGPRVSVGGKRLVAIATSTGGPAALQALMPLLPENLNAGIVIVQHIAPGFTGPLAERLNATSKVTVREARHNEPIKPGVALISPADVHMTIVKSKHDGLIVRLSREPVEATFRPSADVLFNSIAESYAEKTCAVIMTGMGNDGAVGMRSIRDRGGYTIAQDEKTSLIYGMPRWAVKTGGVCTSLPLEQIAAEVVRATLVRKGSEDG